MSDKNKKSKSSLTDYIRYAGNEMTGEERNSFERELQKDPFKEEAAEGFSTISSETAKEDLSILQKRLIEKTKHNTRNNFYRIAAAVAVLMVASGIFFITQRKERIVTLSENINQEKKVPLTVPEPGVLSKQPVKLPEKKQVISAPSRQKSKPSIRSDNKKVAEIEVTEPKVTEMNDSEVTKPNLSIITADEAVIESFAAEKKIDMARAAEAPANAKSEISREYIPPQPLVGKDSFDIYIAKSVRNPEPESPMQQAVIVKFKIKTDSTMTGIKIVSSPGKAWSKEAIRLIKTGPVWKPAIENGKAVEEEVSVKIVFR